MAADPSLLVLTFVVLGGIIFHQSSALRCYKGDIEDGKLISVTCKTSCYKQENERHHHTGNRYYEHGCGGLCKSRSDNCVKQRTGNCKKCEVCCCSTNLCNAGNVAKPNWMALNGAVIGTVISLIPFVLR